MKESPYRSRYGGDVATKDDQCNVHVFSTARWDFGGHRCGNKAKAVADVYSDGVPRPTCALHIRRGEAG